MGGDQCVEQGTVIGGDDGGFIVLQAVVELFIDAFEQLDVAHALGGAVIQRGAQGDGAGAAEVGTDVTEGDHGGHPGDPDFVRGLVHLPGFIECDKAHDQDQGAQQGKYAGSANADLHIP
ncbi:hypothetical protein D3C79_755020 [compost metagenome]